MKKYYRIMLGKKSVFAEESYKGNYIGAELIKSKDLSNHLVDNWRDFNKEFIPVFLEQNPDKTKISAGLACGMLWTIIKGIQIGDVVLCPDGIGNYYVGEVVSNYEYKADQQLPHRRAVKWYLKTINRDEMSQELKNSTGSIGTVSNISKYESEIESLMSGCKPPKIISTDETIEDASVFALEQHLEEFLIKNWSKTELGREYDIFTEDGEIVGQQYPSDTGNIDILAISRDKKELLVIELKKGRASDIVVGQIQRYMGYVQDELLEKGQIVKGIIVAFEDDIRIRRALSVTKNISFYTYKLHFKLDKLI
jgi:restriction system protein